MSLPSKEDARLCASVVKEITNIKGLTGNPAAIGALTTAVARLFNKGLRDQVLLLSEAMKIADIPVARKEQDGLPWEPWHINPGTIDLSREPKNERGHQQQ